MAKMYPDYGTDNELELYFDEKKQSEKKVYQYLRDRLPDEYIVIHSLAWLTNDTNGEADFVIIHPSYGVQFLEVKGGGVRYHPKTSWTSTNRFGEENRIKDPVEQAKNSKYEFIRRWNELVAPDRIFLPAAHGVCFPDMDSFSGQLPHNYHEDIMLMRPKLLSENLKKEIEKMFKYFEMNPVDQRTMDKIKKFFLNSCNFKTSLKHEVEHGKQAIQKMTVEQFKILNHLDRNRHVAIVGGAGTGKTMIAVEKAIRLSNQNQKVLLVCYNEQLYKHLTVKLKEFSNITVANYHYLCARACKKVEAFDNGALVNEYNQRLNKLTVAEKDRFYAEEAPLFLMRAAAFVKDEDKFDAILMDEGQDFCQDWLDSLFDLGKAGKKTMFYIFFDESQNIYNRDIKIPENFAQFALTQNKRNTNQIHDFSKKFKKKTEYLEDPSGHNGKEAELFIVTPGQDENKVLKTVLNRLINEEKIPPGDIAVLSGRSVEKSINLQLLNTMPITTEFDEMNKKVSLNTIHSFKGMESPVVIINNIDYFQKGRNDNLFYVAATRAQIHLIVICNETIAKDFGLLEKDKEAA